MEKKITVLADFYISYKSFIKNNKYPKGTCLQDPL